MSAEKPEAEGEHSAPATEQTVTEQTVTGQTGVGGLERREEDKPDLLLDVPQLNIEELELEVKDLQARVALNAELADFVKINVGVTVHLDEVKLSIKGVEARALLEVKMERVLETLNRALEAIDSDPRILLDSPPYRSGGDTEGNAGGNAGKEAGQTGQPAATDAAVKRARELGVDLRDVEGTGSGGRVVVRDVRRAAREGA